ncbi:hypothetical protein J2Z44_002818, partial [Clostridium punense]|nr:hypothetical protein [Clostridium punense]
MPIFFYYIGNSTFFALAKCLEGLGIVAFESLCKK